MKCYYNRDVVQKPIHFLGITKNYRKQINLYVRNKRAASIYEPTNAGCITLHSFESCVTRVCFWLNHQLKGERFVN